MSGNMDKFVDQLVQFFQLKARLDLMHEPDQLIIANDELKLSLIKI